MTTIAAWWRRSCQTARVSAGRNLPKCGGIFDQHLQARAARFPAVKSLDSFDFAAIPRLNKMQVLEMARCEWIERRENVIALGPSDPAS